MPPPVAVPAASPKLPVIATLLALLKDKVNTAKPAFSKTDTLPMLSVGAASSSVIVPLLAAPTPPICNRYVSLGSSIVSCRL